MTAALTLLIILTVSLIVVRIGGTAASRTWVERQQWADSDRCCTMHISTLRADSGPSLQAHITREMKAVANVPLLDGQFQTKPEEYMGSTFCVASRAKLTVL
jgi:hypothetical protein